MWFNTSKSLDETNADMHGLTRLCDDLGLPKWDTMVGRNIRLVIVGHDKYTAIFTSSVSALSFVSEDGRAYLSITLAGIDHKAGNSIGQWHIKGTLDEHKNVEWSLHKGLLLRWIYTHFYFWLGA